MGSPAYGSALNIREAKTHDVTILQLQCGKSSRPALLTFLESRRRADSWNNVLIQLAADIIPQRADTPVQHLRPTGPLAPVRRCQALNLPWPTFARGRKGGSAWTGGLRFGRCGYSEHRMLLVAELPPYCTAPRQLYILPLLTSGVASQHSFRTTGFQPFRQLRAGV